MQFFENEIIEYAEFAWSTLELKLTPSSEPFDENSADAITANIQISGQWKGIVALKVEHALAQQLAVKMFSIEKEEEVTDEDINDAVSEMTNIIGGNLKSILPQPNKLSLPMVDLKGTELYFPFTEQCAKIVFDCMEKKFMVSIYEVTDKKLQNQPSEEETSPAS
jgi:chemotaxis protein CheX